jgi:maltooligosyltrehalose trehalohydrolase
VGLDRAKVAAAVVFASPFIPMIFQGEEWAASSPFQYFADHEDAEMARLVSEGRKREFAAFGWDLNLIPDPEKRETFERSKLNWNELNEGEHAEMLTWYRALIRLRRTDVALNQGEPGDTQVRFDQQEMWFSMERGDVILFCNLGEIERRFSLPEAGRVVLGSRENLSAQNGDVVLPPDTVAIIKR